MEHENENETNIVEFMKGKQCSILKFGIKPVYMKYYFCSCDPNLMETICESCAVNCHKGDDHDLIENDNEDYKTCQCGLKNHKLQEQQENNKNIKQKCLYADLSIKSKAFIYYKTSISNKNICMFCNNICFKLFENEKIEKQIHDSNENFPQCECNNSDHFLNKFLPENLIRIGENPSIFNFGDINMIQLLNVIFDSSSFEILYKLFIDYYDDLSSKITNDSVFEFDKNIHLTNYFRCLKAFSILGNNKLPFYYINKKITEFFPEYILEKIFERYITDNPGLWSFLNYYLFAFKNFSILPLFSRFQILAQSDMNDISPIQRLNIINNIHKSPYIQNFKKRVLQENNIISLLINGFEKIIKCKFINIEAIDCLIKIASLLSIFSNLYFFTNEQMLRYCQVVDKIFSKLLEFKLRLNVNKYYSNYMEKELNLLSKLSKCLLQFPNIYNDNIILRLLSDKQIIKHEDLLSIKFFHTNNEIGKFVGKNILNIIYLVSKDIDNENLNDNLLYIKNKILKSCSNLICIYINEDDYYINGLEKDIFERKNDFINILFNENKGDEEFEYHLYNFEKEIIDLETNLISCNITQCSFSKLYEKVIKEISQFLLNKSNFSSNYLNFKMENNDEINKFLNYNDKNIKTYSSDNKYIKNFQIYSNKCFIIHHIISSLSLITNECFLSEDLIYNIFNILKSYVSSSSSNCQLTLSSIFQKYINNLPRVYSIYYFNFYVYIFDFLGLNNIKVNLSIDFIENIYFYFIKIPKNDVNRYFCQYYCLQILYKSISHLNKNSFISYISVIRTILTNMYKDYEILIFYKEYLISNKESEEKYNFLFAENIFLIFLILINSIFDDNSTQSNQDFLEEILNKKEIIQILENTNISIEIRIELIKYYRMLYIDVSIVSRKLSNYRLALISMYEGDDIDEISKNNDSEMFYFLNNILSISENNDTSDNDNFELIMKELKYSNTITEKIIVENPVLLLYYYEQALLLPIKVYLNKFFSQAKSKNGKEILNIYDMIVSCLSLKYIMINNDIITLAESNYKTSGFYTSAKDHFKYSILIPSKFTKNRQFELIKSIEEMLNENFKFFDYTNLYRIADIHILSSIKEKKIRNLIDIYNEQDNFTNEEFDNYINLKKEELMPRVENKNIVNNNLVSLYSLYMFQKVNFKNLSIINILSDIQIHFDLSIRNLLLRFLFFISINEKYYNFTLNNDSYYIIYKLLKNDTYNTQKEIELIITQTQNFIDFESLIDIFLKNFLSVILTSYNPSKIELKNDYETCFTIIKVFKFLLERGNQFFQNIVISSLRFDFGDVNTKITLFDFLLIIEIKILILSRWDRNSTEITNNFYFFNIFSAILELLIEAIQGNSEESLSSLLNQEDNLLAADDDINKSYLKLCVLPKFVTHIQQLIFDDTSNNQIIYEVRKQLFEFYLAFLEEFNCPIEIQSFIIDKINLSQVINTLKSTIKKIFFKYENEKENKVNNDVKESTKESNKESLNIKHITNFDECKMIEDTKSYKINDLIYNFFDLKFDSQSNFEKEVDFTFCCTLFRYIKLIHIKFENSEVNYFLEKYGSEKEDEIREMYVRNIKHQGVKSIGLISNHKNLYYEEHYENMLVLKFFNKITKVIEVERDRQIIKVIFTISPDFNLLSKESLDQFLINIPKENRFSKLSYLMDSTTNLLEEMNYTKRQINKKNKIHEFGQKFNYQSYINILFISALIINIIMIIFLDASFKYKELANAPSSGHRLLQVGNDYLPYKNETQYYGPNQETIQKYKPYYGGLSLFFVGLNIIIGILWCYSKLPLLYYNRTISYFNLNKDIKNLSTFSKIKILTNCILKSKLFTTIIIFNFFSLLGFFSNNGSWAFSFTLLIIFNLSTTIETILTALAMRWRSLLAAWFFQLICMYVYSNIAFFFLNSQFSTTIDGEKYYLCRSLVNCMLVFFDFGLRRHGGIGELMPKVSYEQENLLYIGKFFFELSYYLIITVIIMNVVFGIIIDTFRELRLSSKKLEYENENFCLICGAEREVLEKDKINFIHHISNDHYIWNYIHYLIKIKQSNPQDLTSINGHAYESIMNRSNNWFPLYSRDSKNFESEESNEVFNNERVIEEPVKNN